MEWLLVFSLFLSTLNFYFLFKRLSQKPFQQELEEFRSHSERIIVEFNRITTRNVELLDSRIEDLNHKIRLSQKVDLLLKERLEEASKIEFLKPFSLDKVYDDNFSLLEEQKLDVDLKNESKKELKSTTKKPKTTKKTSPAKENLPVEGLFEGIPIEKIKKHKQKPQIQNKQDELKQYIEQQKSKEELLELGFNSNEINLAFICYADSTTENS